MIVHVVMEFDIDAYTEEDAVEEVESWIPYEYFLNCNIEVKGEANGNKA